MSELTPHPIAASAERLDDLRRRLDATRWPPREPVDDWSQGVPLARLQALCAYWRDSYDWRRCETLLNGWAPQQTTIDGLTIRFFEIRSPEAGAVPVVMTHGWPGSPLDFRHVVGPLTDPRAHGGDPSTALHLVLPFLPGHGASGQPAETGWDLARTGRAWIELMNRLGYGSRWAAHGGDWGAAVALAIARQEPAGFLGAHITGALTFPTPDEVRDADEAEQAMLADAGRFQQDGSAYYALQSTRPQTIGYALADSPSGQAAWIYEKLHEWTDHDGDVEELLPRDEILDVITTYWLTNSAASSARLYWEGLGDLADGRQVTVPTAFSMFPREMMRASRRWTERVFSTIVHWGEPARGGHFPAWEQPSIFIDEVRAAVRALAQASS
ncbi:epoxide hydrolase family protein [Amycolatopsis sp. GM8]|uniref:epoxide hydrolase family protein n=1 Tax=Amycolatopsis sp. GM8 TaxID=2896530 RepID=UPI001F19B6DC|nr:epoxide hydrolase family protein [Amycolatopsis sp. GM8]